MTFTVTTPTIPAVIAFVEPEMRVSLPCQCGTCRTPFADLLVQNGLVILEVHARHNGEKHINRLTIGADRRTIE